MGGNIGPIADVVVGKPGNSVTVSVTTEGRSAEELIAQYHLKGSGITVAVTGANGFIGSHIVKLLLGKGYCVRGTVEDLDPAGVDFLKVLPYAAENLSLFKGELLDEGCFDEVFDGCDCVFHLASPTLKDQNDMKMPEVYMVKYAVEGTVNVLQSCEKTGVKTVVVTSSMCAAIPKPDVPKVINETHWADPNFLMNKGSYYSASKTLAERAAVNFVLKLPTKSAFRLVRICPTFTVGPMLHPSPSSSMGRFAALIAGTHHERMPNRSISLIDVRDTAAHHIAAYEMGFEGRFFSLTEAWPWTLVYDALKILRPQMRIPEALPKGTKHREVREYSSTRRKSLRVIERSFMKVLVDAVKECDGIKNVNDSVCGRSPVPLETYLLYNGYYDIGMGDGRFFMINVECKFSPLQRVSNVVRLSWVLEVGGKPTTLEISESTAATIKDGVFTWNAQNISLSFKRVDEGDAAGLWSINGTIGGTQVIGKSFIGGVPYTAFMGTYSLTDASKSVAMAFSIHKNIITDSDGNKIENFKYNPLQRLFSYELNKVSFNLFLNVAAGQGLRLTIVEIGPNTTEFYYRKPKPVFQGGPAGNQVGAGELASFAGYYPLDIHTGAFVSIVADRNNLAVGICLNGETSTQYGSFTFEKDKLTFPNEVDGPSLTFERTFESHANAAVTVKKFQNKQSFFTPTPLTAFGFVTLTGSFNKKKFSLRIFKEGNGYLEIAFKQDDDVVFNTTDDTTNYSYNPIEQDATISTTGTQYILNFTYDDLLGVSCGITVPGGGFVAAVSTVGTVIPDQ